MRRFRKVLFAGVAWSAVCFARLPAQAPAPTVPAMPLAAASPRVSTAALSLSLDAAQRAHDFGQFLEAERLYRQLIDADALDPTALKLALAGVLLDADRAADAEKILESVPLPRSAAWHLRKGLAALQLGRRDEAQAAWDATVAAELSPADRSWHTFLEGALYDLLPVSNTDKANELYRMAEQSAVTELSRARFQLSAERTRLRLTPTSDQRLEETHREALRPGLDLDWEKGRLYAVMLVQRGQAAEALAFLRDNIQRTRGGPRDEYYFLIGLIGDRRRGGEGRGALQQLLATGTKPERMRQALDLLAATSTSDPERAQFRADLDRLVAAAPAHPIRETLLYFRAQFALADKEYGIAENDAEQLLRDFPASRLRAHAFGVLTQSAWDQQRYRRAADSARRARETLLPESAPGSLAARARAELGVLEAEASYRAGMQAEELDGSAGAGQVDYRAAADAYAGLLRERPAELDTKSLGALMLQLVLAEIKAGSPDVAARLDELERDPAFDLENRWKAEWSVARAGQARGDTAAAYARVSRLLDDPSPQAAALPPALRAKMVWLQATLSLDDGQAERTLGHADKLLGALAGLDENLRREVGSKAVQLKAEAEFALGRESGALETLTRLRTEYARSEAAVESYFTQAAYYERQGKIDLAQRSLTALVDNREYAGNEDIPVALLRLARLSKQLGNEENLKAANARIEEMIAIVENKPAAGSVGLIFQARMEQGDILALLGNFPLAQTAYEYLVNRYPQHPDAPYAQLALARCHNAQSASDPHHAEVARTKFEELLYRQNAPAAVRVEAGYNLGKLLERAKKNEEAATLWWRDVVTPQLLARDAPVMSVLDPNLAWWLAKTLIDYGDLKKTLGRNDEAARSYLLVLDKRLGKTFETTARTRLQELGVPVTAL